MSICRAERGLKRLTKEYDEQGQDEEKLGAHAGDPITQWVDVSVFERKSEAYPCAFLCSQSPDLK